MYTIQEEIEMESKIELLPCQTEIVREEDPRGVGVCFYCEAENVDFYSSVYLSKLSITETCKKNCSKFR